MYTDIRYPPWTSRQQLSIGKMVNLRAKKTARDGTCKKKTDSGKHIDNINKVSWSKHRLALIMRTSCSRCAYTLSDSRTVVPILEMHLEITHAITGDIQLVRRSTSGINVIGKGLRTFPGQSRHLTRHSCSPLGAVRIAISNLSSGYFAFIAACATISESGGRSCERGHQAPGHADF